MIGKARSEPLERSSPSHVAAATYSPGAGDRDGVRMALNLNPTRPRCLAHQLQAIRPAAAQTFVPLSTQGACRPARRPAPFRPVGWMRRLGCAAGNHLPHISLRPGSLYGSINCATFGSMPTKISERHAAELERVLSKHEKKQKASVSLSGELIRAADVLAGKAQRSALLERAVRRYFRQLLRRVRHERDLRLIDARAKVTNRESDTLLDLQSWPE